MKVKTISFLVLAAFLAVVAFVLGRIQGERAGIRQDVDRADSLEKTAGRVSGFKVKERSRASVPKGGLRRVEETLRISGKSSSADRTETRSAEVAHEIDGADAGQKTLDELRQRFVSGDAGQRRTALAEIRKAFANRSQVVDVDSLEDDGTSEAARREARLVHDLVESVVDGLSDADETVRNEALATAVALNGDEGNVLMSRIMTTGDESLKNGLLELTTGTPTEKGMKVSLMGLGAREESVRMAAADNLEKLTGTKFATQDEAYDWWESNHADFLLHAAGVSREDNVTTVIEPVPEETVGDGDEETISLPPANGK